MCYSKGKGKKSMKPTLKEARIAINWFLMGFLQRNPAV
jgi:hypothetical protein